MNLNFDSDSHNGNDESFGYDSHDSRDARDTHEDIDDSEEPGAQESTHASNAQYILDPDLVSVVEDLDPDASGTPASWRSRELVLGLIVLLCVLGWVGGSWWHDESNRSHYEQAQQATADRRWDDALANYTAAAGYKDADALASDVARQIEERDRQYEVATEHRSSGPAALVLQAARAVQTIEPGYKDVNSLASQAEAQVYTDALSGTVVMRTQAAPIGLYYMGPSGWHYLQGSDRWSSVLSISPRESNARFVVYDVAGPGWTPPTATPAGTPTPDSNSYDIPQGSPDKAGRALVRVTLPGGPGGSVGPTYSKLHLNPVDYNYYMCNTQGVWGLRYLPSNNNKQIVASSSFGSLSVVYEQITAPGAAPKGAITATVVMPGTDGMVVDFGRDTGLLLLAARGGSIDGKSTTNLYVTAGDGGNARLVFSTTGIVLDAKISPDEHNALVVSAQVPVDAVGAAIPDKMVATAVLVSLGGVAQDAPPVTLVTVSMNALTGAGGVPYLLNAGLLTLDGVFLEQGAFKDTLLLAWRDPTTPTQARLRVVDVSNRWKILYDGAMDYSDFGYVPELEVADGQAILVDSMGSPPSVEPGKQPQDEVLMLSAQTRKDADGTTPSTTVTAANLVMSLPQEGTGSTGTPDSEFVSNPAIVGSNLIYDTWVYTGDLTIYKVYSIPISKAQQHGGAAAQPFLVHTSSFPLSDQTLAVEAQRGTAGPHAYAYVDAQHTLHAHLYDADIDVALERGIEAIFSLTSLRYDKVLF